MSKKETHKATQEAKHDLTTHPDRSMPHQDAIGKYLSALAYSQSRRAADEDEADDRRGTGR